VDKPIYVTQPSLASLEEYNELLKGIWERGILTHNGPLVQRLENEICEQLNIENFVAVSNGTIALQVAIKALELKGEIITTPFTWIATISAIKWEDCKPIFCDIDPNTLNIDHESIESLITEDTVAIMPVHVFGNPCNIDEIERIAKKHNLKVIYDAAHAIGSKYNNKSILEFGDISATSMHATKILNSAEGGGCITNNNKLTEKLKRIRFFGHDNKKNIIEDGFNGKLTEIHAALGIVNLKYLHDVLEDRKNKYNLYVEKLSHIKNIKFQKNIYGETNYSYFPLIFQTEGDLINVKTALNKNNFYPRRYFYPSVNTFSKVVKYKKCGISETISLKILCLPLYKNLNKKEIHSITNIIHSTLCKK